MVQAVGNHRMTWQRSDGAGCRQTGSSTQVHTNADAPLPHGHAGQYCTTHAWLRMPVHRAMHAPAHIPPQHAWLLASAPHACCTPAQHAWLLAWSSRACRLPVHHPAHHAHHGTFHLPSTASTGTKQPPTLSMPPSTLHWRCTRPLSLRDLVVWSATIRIKRWTCEVAGDLARYAPCVSATALWSIFYCVDAAVGSRVVMGVNASEFSSKVGCATDGRRVARFL
eukprot:352431-Chlamydomonas_euryale.AAC.5